MRTLLNAGFLVLTAATLAAATPEPVTYLPADQVAEAFARGKPLVEMAGYKVHASRREGPGQAEIHQRDTDIIYVLQGSATLVTGGEATEPHQVAPEEIRGTSIQGGETRRLAPGDVVIVPSGVAHWFQSVEPPFLYYVVKVPGSPEVRP